MTNREQLQENYEDALFAMWMDDFAHRRGEALLAENERLKADPEAAVPEKLQRKNLNLIERELRKNARTFTARKLGKTVLRFIAVAAILATLFGCAYAFSPAFRAGTLNLLMQWDEDAAAFQLVEDSASVETPALMPNVTVGWLPEGYIAKEAEQDRLQTTVDCTNAEGDIIRIRVFTEDQTLYSLDIEESAYCEDILVQGCAGLLVLKDDLLRIMWADPNTNTYILLYSSAVNSDLLLQIAEDISISW